MKIRKHWLFRYGLAVALFWATLGLSLLLTAYDIKINLTIPVVLALVAAVWYGGRGPGLLIAVLFQATTIWYAKIPADSTVAKAVFGYFSVFLLYVFMVWVISNLQCTRDELRVRVRQQAAVAELGQAALSSIPLAELLPKATELVRSTLGVDYSAVCELVTDNRTLRFTAASGWVEDVLGFEFDYEASRSLAGHVMSTAEAVTIEDTRTDDRFEGSEMLIRNDVRSGIGVKIFHRDKAFGVLGAFDREPRKFSRDDVNFLQSVANIIAEAAGRLRSEEESREQREWLKTTLWSIGDGVIATDREGVITLMNSVAQDLTEWTEDEALGKPLTDVFHIFSESTGVAYENPVETVMATGYAVGVANHTVLRSKSGKEIPITDSGAPIKNRDEIIGVVLVFADVTERKKAEAASAMLASIVESSNDAIVSKDLNGTVTSWNKAAEGLFGYTAQEMVGQPVTMLIPDDLRDEEPGILERIRRGEAIGHYETVRQHKDGRLIEISLNISPVFGPKGEIVGASKIARDITDRKQAAAARREREIMERLVEAQESERHRIARDLHDHLGQKMTALRLRIESLSKGDEGEMPKKVGELQEAASGIDRDIGFLSWELRPTELEDLGITDALRSYVREWSAQYGIAAEFHGDRSAYTRESAPFTKSEETNIYRIVQEALTNILKHAKAQNVSVLMQRRDDLLVLIIEDDGVGFDAEQLSPGGSGDGLGLLGINERVALLGGEVEIDSASGSGTTIIARIPIKGPAS